MKKLIVFLFAIAIAVVSHAQVVTMYNALGTNLQTDTVTNAGTGYVQIKLATPLAQRQVYTTAFFIRTTKISGTVAGSITILGSLDGTNYKVIPTMGTQTAYTAITAADASTDFTAWIVNSPYPWYRVSWTGSGTMAATISAKVYRN